MNNHVLKAGWWVIKIMVPILLLVAFLPAYAFAAIGESKRQIEAQYGTAYLIQDETKRIWSRQDWQSGIHGKAAVYGYLDTAGDWQVTRWIQFNKQDQVVKETVLFGTAIRIRDFQQYFSKIYNVIASDNSIVFTSRFFSGEHLGAVVRTDQGRLNHIEFFIVPDSTKINMHSKMRGFEITEITSHMVKSYFDTMAWRRTDNYFQNKLFFSEKLVSRITTDMIVIHHTALEDMSVADIHELHLTKGWAGIAYHKVILADGTIQDGRPEKMIGAHALGANPRSIGIVLDGNFENKPPTAAQMDSLVRLTRELMAKYHIPLENVVPHRDVTKGTSCPGEQFPWAELMQRLTNRDEDVGQLAASIAYIGL